jgi:2-polyprenyl-6-hydroxyphenyl methylase/3-demethylubiquinone-9 3-methyltransferase
VSDYVFRRCKYCGEPTAKATYDLGDNLLIYVCGGCDFHFLNRLDPVAGDESAPGLAQSARNYIDRRLQEPAPQLAQRLQLVRRQVRLDGARCLDIGAGVGQFLLAIKQQGAQGQGIEPSRLRREYARQTFALELRAELVEQPYWQRDHAATFDLITLWDVLEHVNFPVETLQQTLPLLKPGGWLFLETPSRLALSYRLSQLVAHLSGGQLPLFLASHYSAAPFGHKQIFTPDQVCRLLEGLGLQLLIKRRSYGSALLRRDKIILGARKPAGSEGGGLPRSA